MNYFEEFTKAASAIAEDVARVVKEKAPIVMDTVTDVATATASIVGAAVEAGKGRYQEIQSQRSDAANAPEPEPEPYIPEVSEEPAKPEPPEAAYVEVISVETEA